MIAINRKHLLSKINGRVIDLSSGNSITETSAKEEGLQMSVTEKLLNIISDPNFAYILMMIGFYGLLFELYNRGPYFRALLV